jgi:hypothetical protein
MHWHRSSVNQIQVIFLSTKYQIRFNIYSVRIRISEFLKGTYRSRQVQNRKKAPASRIATIDLSSAKFLQVRRVKQK